VAPSGSAADRRRESGSLEHEVMAALWAADEPMTPGHVQRALDADLAYTTVMTILTRLHRKGLVKRARVGRAYAYSPAERAEEHAAQAMTDLLARGTDTAAVLSRFVERLGPDDEDVLRGLLERARRAD
jgi:predicted transcriptional regulator